LPDRGGDFAEVGFAVEPRIIRVGFQPLDRPALDLICRPGPRRARNCGIRWCRKHNNSKKLIKTMPIRNIRCRDLIRSYQIDKGKFVQIWPHRRLHSATGCSLASIH